jgi:chromosome segregation ATPase
MSTAGKVLTVLILLVSVVWLVLMSAVTQLNVNWQEKIAAQQKNLDQATAELAKSQGDFLSLTEQARLKQNETDLKVSAKEGEIVGAQARRSSRVEDLTRLKAQVADTQVAAETAKGNLATREAELIANQEELAKKRDEIAKAKAANADLKTQLAQLQSEFKRLLAENAAKLDKASKAGTVLPASSVRQPGPSS